MKRLCWGLVFAALAPVASADASKLHVAGRLSADAVVKISGTGSPRALVLSKDGRYGPGDVVLGASVKRGRGRFSAWVSMPETALKGKLKLLGCKTAKPGRRSCKALASVKVGSPRALRIATPVLDTAHTATGVLGRLGGSVTATGADGTTYTVTVPANDAAFTPVTLTPVTTLSPSGGFELLHGVMVEPVGTAPPGSTLTITSPAAPPAGAGVIAFGGADPSGAAFHYPATPGATTTITLTTFGGYGIARAAGRAARLAGVKAGPVACPRAAGATGLAHAAAGGARPLISCVTAAQVLDEWSQKLGVDIAKGVLSKQAYEEAVEAVYKAVEQEASPILASPPTEEGAAELTQIAVVVIGIERQDQLLSAGNRALLRGTLGQIERYSVELYKKLCTGPVQNSGVIEDYIVAAIGTSRQTTLFGQEESTEGLQSVVEACIKKLHVKISAEIKSSDHYALLGSGVAAGTTAKASAVVIGESNEGLLAARYGIEGGNPSLQYSEASASLESPPAGVTVSVGKQSGELLLKDNVFLAGHQRIRCDKNRHFVVEHFDYLFVQPVGLWKDQDLAVFSESGIEVPQPLGLVADGWAERFHEKPDPSKALNPSQYVVVRVSPDHPETTDAWLPGVGPTTTKSAEGKCEGAGAVNECRDYKFGATFEGQGLPG